MRFHRQLNGYLGIVAAILLTVFAGQGFSDDSKSSTLDVQLRKEAESLNKMLRERYIKGDTKSINVAVLKFRVKRAGESNFTDNAGPLNMLMANRLEVALVLSDSVGINTRRSNDRSN